MLCYAVLCICVCVYICMHFSLIDDKLRLRFGSLGEELTSTGGFNPYAPNRRCVADPNLDSIEYLATALWLLPVVVLLLQWDNIVWTMRVSYFKGLRKWRQIEKRSHLVRYGLCVVRERERRKGRWMMGWDVVL